MSLSNFFPIDLSTFQERQNLPQRQLHGLWHVCEGTSKDLLTLYKLSFFRAIDKTGAVCKYRKPKRCK